MNFSELLPSKTYLFIIILSPSGAYYASGLAPVGIWIEDEYVRAVRGGIGYAKTGGNYAASLIAQVKAHDDGIHRFSGLTALRENISKKSEQ